MRAVIIWVSKARGTSITSAETFNQLIIFPPYHIVIPRDASLGELLFFPVSARLPNTDFCLLIFAHRILSVDFRPLISVRRFAPADFRPLISAAPRDTPAACRRAYGVGREETERTLRTGKQAIAANAHRLCAEIQNAPFGRAYRPLTAGARSEAEKEKRIRQTEGAQIRS